MGHVGRMDYSILCQKMDDELRKLENKSVAVVRDSYLVESLLPAVLVRWAGRRKVGFSGMVIFIT